MSSTSKWRSFITELSNLIFFWFFGVVFFFLFRVIFISMFSGELRSDVELGEVVDTFIMGFRFDCVVTAYFMLLPVILLLVLSYFNQFKIIKYSRIVCQYLFVILSTLICVITLNFYKEFNSQFNNFLFLGIYDDQKAVLKTIIQYYNPILNTLAVVITIVASLFIFKYFEKCTFIYNCLIKINKVYGKVLLILVLLFLFVCCARGTFTQVPAIRKWASVAKDPFLNKTIINPFKTLKYAYEDYSELSALDGKNPFSDEDLKTVYQKDSVSQIIQKFAQGNTIERPKQIFIVIMESYDSWPLMEKYQPFGFSKNLSRIAKEGTHFTNFLPTYQSTFYAYGAIVSGIPYCGFNISVMGTLQDPYVSSTFNMFKKLGYKTNFFYGGFVSWENIGDFTHHQGCDKIYSGVDAGGKSDSGDWGIEDEKLYDLILQKVNPDEYTLNIVLTSSYHAPYAIDIYKKGFPYKSAEDFPPEVRNYYKGKMTFQEMGHLWYGDFALGKFMDAAKEKYGDGLFCFTGDHYGRRFVNHSPNLYERSSVPFIIYGKGVPKEINLTPGSHIDIVPTIMEMVAPKGFEYYGFGQSLFLPGNHIGIGFEKIIDRDSLFFFPSDALHEKINLHDFKGEKNDYK